MANREPLNYIQRQRKRCVSKVSQRYRKWLQQLSRFPRRLMQQKKTKTQLCRVNYCEVFGPHFNATQGISLQRATWMLVERILLTLITGPCYKRLRSDHDHRVTWENLFSLVFIFGMGSLWHFRTWLKWQCAPGCCARRPHEMLFVKEMLFKNNNKNSTSGFERHSAIIWRAIKHKSCWHISPNGTTSVYWLSVCSHHSDWLQAIGQHESGSFFFSAAFFFLSLSLALPLLRNFLLAPESKRRIKMFTAPPPNIVLCPWRAFSNLHTCERSKRASTAVGVSKHRTFCPELSPCSPADKEGGTAIPLQRCCVTSPALLGQQEKKKKNY